MKFVLGALILMAGSWGSSSDSGSLSYESYKLERRIEPIYAAFLCPITNKVMQDPVSLESGVTVEREAIEKWFRECVEKGRIPTCPVTKKELRNMDLNPSIALLEAIKEWTARNEAVELDMAQKSLCAGASEKDILHALRFIQYICKKSQMNKDVVHKAELIYSIVELLKNISQLVRCKALETLGVVAEENSDTKEIVAEGDTVRTIVKLLSDGQPREKKEAVSLLYELSKSETLCEKIGSIKGAILILVGMASSKSENPVVVEKADKTLDNLTKCLNNVRQMAGNGRLQPLLTLLLEGPLETKISMAGFLGDVALNHDVKVQVARTVGSSLINLMKSGDMSSREAALKALNQISTCDMSAKVLIEAGILPPLVKDLFTVGPKHLPMRLKEVSATILSNLVNSGYNFDSIVVGPGNQTLVSENVIHNLLQLISNTGPAIECKLVQVLVGLTSSPGTVLKVVAAIKSVGATISLIQFVEAPERDRDLRLACIKLLHRVSPHMSQELADALHGTTGELRSLLRIILENAGITEQQAEAVGLLAHLPERDAILTRQMLDEGVFPHMISRVKSIRQGEMMGNRYTALYQEGLVRVLARITYVLGEEPEAVALCIEHNVAALFVDLLPSNGLDNVQIVSAWALQNLSRQSKKLSHKPVAPPPSCFASIFMCVSRAPDPDVSGSCPVHQGICSLGGTFCLLEGQAVERLISLLDNPNEKAVEASLAALSTLLEDEVNVEEGVLKIYDMEGFKCVLQVLVDDRNENLRRSAVWAVERFLRTEDIARDVAADQRVVTALVDAFQHADYRTRQIAERGLRHLDRIPNFSGIFPNMG